MIKLIPNDYSSDFDSAFLFAIALYHLVVGIFSIMSLEVIRKIGASLYAVQLPAQLDPRYAYALKALGAYALTLSALVFFAMNSDSIETRIFFMRTLAALLLLRALFRSIYRDLVFQAFAIPWKRSLWNVVFNTVVAGILIYRSDCLSRLVELAH